MRRKTTSDESQITNGRANKKSIGASAQVFCHSLTHASLLWGSDMKKFSTPVIRFSPEHGQDITTVRDLTDRAADNWGEKIFLLSPETKRTVTFYKLKQTAVKLTRHFLGLGICKGDKISFISYAGSQFYKLACSITVCSPRNFC